MPETETPDRQTQMIWFGLAILRGQEVDGSNKLLRWLRELEELGRGLIREES